MSQGKGWALAEPFRGRGGGQDLRAETPQEQGADGRDRSAGSGQTTRGQRPDHPRTPLTQEEIAPPSSSGSWSAWEDSEWEGKRSTSPRKKIGSGR